MLLLSNMETIHTTSSVGATCVQRTFVASPAGAWTRESASLRAIGVSPLFLARVDHERLRLC